VPAISLRTHEVIKAYLEVFIENLVHDHQNRPVPHLEEIETSQVQTSSEGRLKPFHAAVIPEQLLRLAAFERSFSTRLGSTFEECARLIALEHHAEVKRGYDIIGEVSIEALNQIERIVATFEHAAEAGNERPSFEAMIDSVIGIEPQGEIVERTARADLYIRTHDNRHFFFEIKSPVPNKGQCLEVTQRLLRFHLLTGLARPTVRLILQWHIILTAQPVPITDGATRLLICRSIRLL
jgi:hypothetical protein